MGWAYVAVAELGYIEKKMQAYVLKSKQVGLVSEISWYVTSAPQNSFHWKNLYFLTGQWGRLHCEWQVMGNLKNHEKMHLSFKVKV